MNRTAVAVIIIIVIAVVGTGYAMSPVDTPVQYGQFCQVQKVSGSGAIDISTSIEDSETSVDYHSSMSGRGEIELNHVQDLSQRDDLLLRRVDSLNSTNYSRLNLFDNLGLTYSGKVPLIGKKDLSGAFGASIEENFAVYEIEQDQTAYITSTKNGSEMNPNFSPVHSVGLDTRNSFNGTWGTDAFWSEMLSKDLKAHESFKGLFDVEKLIKFHESPDEEKEEQPECYGIDC